MAEVKIIEELKIFLINLINIYCCVHYELTECQRPYPDHDGVDTLDFFLCRQNTIIDETFHLPEERLSLPGNHNAYRVEVEVDYAIVYVLDKATIPVFHGLPIREEVH